MPQFSRIQLQPTIPPTSRFAPHGGVLPMLEVPDPEQWLSRTSGRVVADGYSWLQAVHWVIGAGVYRPRRSHGPRTMGRTTVRVAQQLAELSPCRPGIAHLMRQLRTSERTVQYHLAMLRESGLLAYVIRGNRSRGERDQASEYVLIIPEAFDNALGVRTLGTEAGRRVTGIAETGRPLMALLGRRAVRKMRARRPRTKKPTAAPPALAGASYKVAALLSSHTSQDTHGTSREVTRCTPMELGTSKSSSDGHPILPPESKLASGTCNRTGSQKRQQRVVNRVGRRYQLAFELIQQVPWLNRASVPRIAWVVRALADAGWTTPEVLGWLETSAAAGRIRRPSGFLAARIAGAHLVITTPEQRRKLADAWRDSRRSAAARHTEWDGEWRQPTSPAVRRQVDQAMTTLSQAAHQAEAPSIHGHDDPEPRLEDLTTTEVVELRTLAQRNPNLVWMAIAAMGETFARRLYTHAVVDQLQRLQRGGSTMVIHGGWGLA